MANLFQAQLAVTAIVPDGGTPGRWHLLGNITFGGPSSYGFDGNSVALGDIVVLQSSSPLGQTHKFVVDQIDSQSAPSIDIWITYDDTDVYPTAITTGTGIISKPYINNNQTSRPSSLWCQVSDYLVAYIDTKNAEAVKTPNKYIQGQSGFAAHELDGSNNDVNSYIEWDNTDQTHNHRAEPKIDGQDLDIKIAFQFPSQFDGLRTTGNAFEFYAKADNGSGDAVNYNELISLIDVDGTEYAVTGKQATSTGRSLIALTKSEVDDILNPILSSS